MYGKQRVCYLTLTNDGIPLKKLLHHNLLTLTGNLHTETQTQLHIHSIQKSQIKASGGSTFVSMSQYDKNKSGIAGLRVCVCVFVTHDHVCHDVVFQRQLDPIPAETYKWIDQRRAGQAVRQTGSRSVGQVPVQ